MLWNVGGYCLPVLVAIPASPVLVHALGKDRFGVLALVTAAVGYFSLFDLGLGRALLHVIAKTTAIGHEDEVPSIIWSALTVMLILGIVGASVMALLTPWLISTALKVPANLRMETLHAFYLLAASIPLTTTSTGFRAVLEARLRFGLVNAIRVPFGVFTFLGPVLVLPFSHNLAVIVMVLLGGRVVTLVAHLVACANLIPTLATGWTVQRDIVGTLLRYGGWMTVSNVVSPILVYVDRFFVGALVSIVAVSYYTTPYEAVTRLGFTAGAVAGVLFPVFAGELQRDISYTAQLFTRAVKYMFLLSFPAALVIVCLASDILRVWMASDFARESTPVLQWLTVGVFVNALAQLPMALIQGAGRPDLAAKLHLLELVLYALLLWWLVRTLGITGAAVAWAVRATVDAVLLFVMSRKLLRIPGSTSLVMAMTLVMSLATLIVARLPPTLGLRAGFLLFVLPVFAMATWFIALTPRERAKGIKGISRGYRVARTWDGG